VAARHIAHHLGSFSPDEAFTCGLLAQIGRLALATAYPYEYADVLAVATTDERERLLEIEGRTFGINHFELAAAMMADWCLPAIFSTAVGDQADGELAAREPATRVNQAGQILGLAESIAMIVPRSTVYRDTLSFLVITAARVGVSPEVFGGVFDAISREWRETGSVYNVHTRKVPPLSEIYAQARERREVIAKTESDRCAIETTLERDYGRA